MIDNICCSKVWQIYTSDISKHLVLVPIFNLACLWIWIPRAYPEPLKNSVILRIVFIFLCWLLYHGQMEENQQKIHKITTILNRFIEYWVAQNMPNSCLNSQTRGVKNRSQRQKFLRYLLKCVYLFNFYIVCMY